MKVIIVDDSRLARKELLNLLKPFGNIDVIAETGDPDDAIKQINLLKPELIFLDIQMPGKNGFELLDTINHQPMVIFTTAYDEYALRSFEYDAVDYLLKPVDPKRLASSLNKVIETKGSEPIVGSRLSANSSVFIKDGDECWFVEITKIQHFESLGNYTKVYFDNHHPLLHKSLNQIELRLPEGLFFRANRQSIINLRFINSVDLNVNNNLLIVLKNGTEVEISRRNTAKFKQLLSL